MLVKNYQAFLEAFLGFGKKNVPYYFSDRFRKVLRTLGDNRDEVAQQLIYAEDSNQVEDDITLIDLTEKEDMVSFIQLNRMERFRKEDDTFTADEFVDYIRKVWRYTDKSLKHKGWTEQRTEISIGRFVSRVYQKAKIVPDAAKVEKFVNSYKTRIKMINDVESLFEFVRGEDIKKWYLEDNYQYNRGQLSNSCMRYQKCQDYFDIYTKNPEVCQLLILKGEDENKIIGRALVWKLKNGQTYMDRQYCNNDSDMNLYVEFAKKKGWSYYSGLSKETLEVQLKSQEIKKFPYMDTFVCYNHKKHLLSDDEDLWPEDGWWKLQNTNGTYLTDEVVYSEWNGEYIQRQEAVFCRDVNDWLRNDQAIYLEYKDLWYSPESDEVCWSDYDEEYYHIDDAIYSEYLETYLFTDRSIVAFVTSDDEMAIPSEMSHLVKKIEINGEEKNCFIPAIMINPLTGEWCFKKDTIKLVFSTQLNSYVREEEANSKDLEIQKSKYKRISLAEYFANKIEDVEPEDLLNYLIKLEPTQKVLNKINDFYKNSRAYYLRDESTYTTLEKFQILKAALWFGYDISNRNSYFKVYDNNKSNQPFLRSNEEILLEFMSTNTYSKIYSQGFWRTFLEDCEFFVFDIIEDPEKLKIYYSLKYK